MCRPLRRIPRRVPVTVTTMRGSVTGPLGQFESEMFTRPTGRRDVEGHHAVRVDFGHGADDHIGRHVRRHHLTDIRSTPLLTRDLIGSHPQVPGDLGGTGELPLDPHGPSAVRPGDLGRVETELVDECLVALDTAARRWYRLIGEHAAQPAEAHLPTGGEARPAVPIVERMRQCERGSAVARRQVERQVVVTPAEAAIGGAHPPLPPRPWRRPRPRTR